MFKIKRKLKLTFLTVLAILSLSTIMPALVFAAPLANDGEDWQYVNGNSWAWNYSPQNQINKDNVDDLEVKWVFPLRSSQTASAAIRSLNPTEGTTTPPIVVNGIVYVTSNSMTTYAVNAKTGAQIWTHSYSVDLDEARDRLPLIPSSGHYHGIRYWVGEDVLLLPGIICDFYGVDAKTGEQKFSVDNLCANVPGNLYLYSPSLSGMNSIGTFDKGRQFIISYGSSDLTAGVGRSVIMGIDMDSHNIVWRVFNQAPQGNVLSKDWALLECDNGYFRDIPCSAVREQARENLEWSNAPGPNQPQSPAAGSTNTWGQPVVDEETGLLYMNTGNQNPWTNISTTIGPRLYGSTIMAIDMNAGQRLWWQQPMPRDPYDYDCNWSGMLMNDPTIGKVYVKGCKEGYWTVSDALTGKPIHMIEVFEEQYPGIRTTHITDPFSRYDMIEWKWPEGSKYHPTPTDRFYAVPSFLHGTFSTDETYNPESGTVFHYAALMDLWIASAPILDAGFNGARLFGVSGETQYGSVRIVARDLATGTVKWTWDYEFSNQRAQMVTTGDLLFSAFTDGTVKYFNADTGQLLREQNIGSPVLVGPTIAKDTDGNSKIFVLGGPMTIVVGFGPGQYGVAGQTDVPGTLIAIGLSDKAVAQAVTTTITSTSTTSVTEEVGMSSTITYAAVAVAVIAVIAAVLFTRKTK